MERPMRYAYEIYRQKSFSKAAEALYISQPALSAIIRKLEESLGTALFDRSTKPVSLTPEGEYYMQCAVQIMNIEKGMEQYFDDISTLKKGTLHIGASTYFCCSVLPDLFHAFRKKYPYITVHLEENNSTPQLKEHLQNREIDFALSSNTYPPEDYDSFVLDSEAIILAVPCTDTINETLQDMYYTYDEMIKLIEKEEWTSPALKKVSPVLFKDQKFITIDKNSDLYPRILRMFKEYDETPEIIMHLQQMSSCYYMAAGGFGSAFLRSSTLRTFKDTGNLYFYLIDSPLSIRQTRFYYKKGGYVSKAMQAFMDFTREALAHEKSE